MANSESQKPTEQENTTNTPARGRIFFRRLKVCPFAGSDDPIDFKDVKLLKRFLSARGKIMPRRLTFVTMKRQRELVRAIKRARFLALLPYVSD